MGHATTIGTIIPERAARGGSSPALRDARGVLTADELLDAVRRLATALAQVGAGPGARVALRLAEGRSFVVAHGAAAYLGATVVPLPADLPKALAETQLRRAAPELLVTDADADAVTGLAQVRLGWPPGEPEASPWPQVDVGNGPRPITEHEPRDAPAEVESDAPALLFLTSGTTGTPKVVTLSHAQALAGMEAWTGAWSFGPDTVSAMAAPLSHVVYNPLVLGALREGGAVALLRRRTPRAVAAAVGQHRITALMAPPALWLHVLDDPRVTDTDLTSLDTVIHGAAPMAVSAKAELARRLPGAAPFDCYGLTETASAVCVLAPSDRAAHGDTVGRPHPGVELSIRDEAGAPVPVGSEGEVCCRGPGVITTYGDTELDARRFVDGWLRTGDLGQVDDAGFLTLRGRVDDMINVAGEKVHAADVEAALLEHPSVLEALAVALPDTVKGEVVGAAVVLRSGAAVEPDALLGTCRAALPSTFVPRRLVLRGELPRTPAGKPDRQALVAELSK
jgi:fatty-acyl-CoA synthase